jgi:hypothetical protein
MSYFSTRIVLHTWATVEDYSVLHNAMAKNGFSRTITASDGRTYQLPPAEYVLIGNYKLNDVLGWADSAALQTGKRDSVVVTEGTAMSWRGLKPL